MRIQSSQVELSSQHLWQRQEQQLQVRQQRVVEDESAMRNERGNRPDIPPGRLNTPAATVDLSNFRVLQSKALERIEALSEKTLQILDVQTQLLKALVESMTGKSIDDPAIDTEPEIAPAQLTSAGQAQAIAPADNPTVETTTLSYYRLEEYEYSNVEIGAMLIDDDGSSFSINLSLTMERAYSEESLNVSVQRGKLTDPLVFSFNGDSVRLSNETTAFDLNTQREGLEQIATLSSDSAYLALDKNGNGIIDNGSELFGPTSGNGFAELAQYDEDGNGFIDEGDSVFSQLQLFRPGDGLLQDIDERGVAAIFLGAVASPFSLTDANNQLLGQIRSTGFYITDNKQAGAVQQLDLVV